VKPSAFRPTGASKDTANLSANSNGQVTSRGNSNSGVAKSGNAAAANSGSTVYVAVSDPTKH
jgi:hypothetical protein